MYEHSCRNARADGCGFKAKASTEADLRAALQAHVKARHRVNNLTDTIYGYLRATAAR